MKKKKKNILVHHCGVTIRISATASKNKINGRVYESYQLADYSTGKRKRITLSDLNEAKLKARELAEAHGTHHTFDWDAQTHAEVRRAIALADTLNLNVADICQRFADAVKILGGDPNLLLPAAHYFQKNATSKRLELKIVNDAVAEFQAQHLPTLGTHRRKNNTSTFKQFTEIFGARQLHEIEALEIQTWLRSKNYAAQTQNGTLNLLSQFFKWAVGRHYAIVNPASRESVNRKKIRRGDIGIFSPAQARKLLSAIPDQLKPFAALWCFSGLRKEEVSRLSWEQVGQALDGTGNIYLQASQSKTGVARSVPTADNLRLWLVRYRQSSGSLLPPRWQGKNPVHQLSRLGDLTQMFARALGTWVMNGPRHSFASYALALTKDPGEVVRQMGTSLQKLQQHYWSRAQAITVEQGREWFSITPDEATNILPLSGQEQNPAERNHDAAGQCAADQSITSFGKSSN